MILDRWERPYYVSLCITVIAVLYNVFALMLRFAFLECDSTVSQYKIVWHTLDSLSDCVYIFDMVAQSRTGYLDEGILIQDVRSLAIHYFKSRGFRLDFLSILPTDILFYAQLPVRNLAAVRLNRLLRLPRLFEFLERTSRLSSSPLAVRAATLILYLLIIVHWNACFYYYVSELIGFGVDQWVFNATLTNDLLERYFRCVYWVAMTLTNGESLNAGPAQTNLEMILTTFNVLLGILIFATIVGNIGSLVTEGMARRTTFNRWQSQLVNYMKEHEIADQLKHKVNKWLLHLWSEDRAAGVSDDALKPLPDRLQAEINMNVHLDTLRQVKIFQDCEPGLLSALVNKLKLVVFNRKEFVCKFGDVGKEMYIVRSGLLNVYNSHQELVGSLTAGSVFGELSLLNISGTKTGNRRTASVQSVGYTYTFCLTKEDLWSALKNFPDASTLFIKKGREILIREGLLEKSSFLKASKLLYRKTKVENLSSKSQKLISRISSTLVGLETLEKKLDERIEILEEKMEKYRQKTNRKSRRLSKL